MQQFGPAQPTSIRLAAVRARTAFTQQSEFGRARVFSDYCKFCSQLHHENVTLNGELRVFNGCDSFVTLGFSGKWPFPAAPRERDFERGVAGFQRLRQFCDSRFFGKVAFLSCVISRIEVVKKLKWCFERERDNFEELL
ncbi:hypothetical protein pipiens_007089 [Culex pipiens pipiens]|uniref:Uncharacterized protein n=1 Tax=Culex pipiens pipiens TaxID=38569 RepID=A0ABD1DM78_CULPP